jgi:NosR/NirI family transcriptional regulator, nitrite reductase regulator
MLGIVAGLRCASAENAADAARMFAVPERGIEVSPPAGTPPVSEVRQDGRLLGYLLSTWSVSGSLGYAGKPLDILVALRPDGIIAGAHLIRHEEPILVIGITPGALEAFVAGLKGLDAHLPVTRQRPAKGGIDHLSGATVSSTVIKDAVLRSARAILAAQRTPAEARGAIDRSHFAPRTWPQLVAEGAIASRHITRGEVDELLGVASEAPRDLFIEFFAALLTPPTIGQNLIGRRAYDSLTGRLGSGDNAILVAARGLYSFMGTSWRQSGRFDRFRIVQGTRAITLEAADFDLVETLAAEGAPELREIGIFRLAESSGFDPAKPWRLELMVEKDGRGPAAVALDYRLPPAFLVQPTAGAGVPARSGGPASDPAAASAALPSLPEEIWAARASEIAVLGVMLTILTATLFFHDLLVRRVQLYRGLRLSFLAMSLGFLGFYAGAQLSVIHVVTFIHAVLHGFRWEQFMLDPLVFILWSFVALCLLFWGRGVFCGWLCPFGALQELLNEAARKLGIRQIEVPWALHERLWPIKYTAFLAILGISFQSTAQVITLAEIEPFKTAIVLKFIRAWPYVAYVVVLLAGGLFIERLYCRYLCPLGAALAIPARLRIFDWLKRRPQCGRECRICSATCTVQAINPIGQIVPNECIYCLQCQANYYDATTCLPLKQRAQRGGGSGAGAAQPGRQT